jgi:hypothetical protein
MVAVVSLAKSESGLFSLLFDHPELRRWIREDIVF